MAHVRITWARFQDVPRVRLVYPNGLEDVFPEAELEANLPQGAEVHGYYRDGPYLLSRLVGVRDAGYINRVVLRPYFYSHPFVRTTIAGTNERTARLWTDRTPESLMVHPVFERMHPYIPLGSPQALAGLITHVFDPRWYSDPRRPNRWARIEQALSLSPRGDRKPDSYQRRVVRACWAANGDDPGKGNDPADFYGRRHAALLEAGVPEPVAVRKVGRLLVKAVVAAWLEGETGGDPVFEPGRLFDAAAVEAAGQ